MPTYVCPISVVDSLEARTDWISEQRANPTISRVMHFLRRNEKPTEHDLLDDPLLKQYLDVWNQLVVESKPFKHVNEWVISTRIVVPPAKREVVFHALHHSAHCGYEATMRRITQRFWWPRVRADVSAFVKSCEVCDRDRCSNPSYCAPLLHLPADKPFGAIYIDIV